MFNGIRDQTILKPDVGTMKDGAAGHFVKDSEGRYFNLLPGVQGAS